MRYQPDTIRICPCGSQGAQRARAHICWSPKLALSLWTLFVFACLASTAHATLRVWTGAATGDSRWSTTGNWQSGAPQTGDDLEFTANATHPVNNDDYANGTTFNSIFVLDSGGGPPNGTFTVRGNTIALNAGVTASNTAANSWDITVSNALTLNSNQTFTTGPLSSLTFQGPINLNGNSLTMNCASGSPIDVHAVVSGAGNILKTNAGTLTLWSNNTYAGSTTLNGGTLQVYGNQPTSPIALIAGTFYGQGTVGTITAQGSGGPSTVVFNPGLTQLSLTCSNLTLNSAAIFQVVLSGEISGVTYNTLAVHGSVALNNATLGVSLGFTPAIGDSFTIISNDGTDPVSGTFNGLPEGTLFNAGGLYLRISYAGGDGNDVVLTRAGRLLTVTNTADSGDGSLRATMATAINGDNINFASNVTGTITLTSGQLLVDKSINIFGPGPAILTLDGHIGSRVFVVTNGVTAAISGLTITNGLGLGGLNGFGAGIYNDHSTLTVSNCVISDNRGQGIFNNGQSGSAVLTLSGCTIARHNIDIATGGGVGNDGTSGSASLTMMSCTVYSNQSASGGGIANANGTLMMMNCTVSSNTSSGTGGMVNRADTGNTATLKVFASTFSGNSGGAIFNTAASGGSATLEIGNTLLQQAGPALSIENTGNAAATSDGYNLANDNASGVLTNATDQTNANPLLGLLANNGGPVPTQALLWGSPAIDRGKAFGLTTDARGMPRPHDFASITNATGGDGSDIGAFEFIPPSAQFTSIAAQTNAVQLQGSGLSNLTYAIQAATNLSPVISWTNIGAALANSNGVFSFTDTNTPAPPVRFYRAVSP